MTEKCINIVITSIKIEAVQSHKKPPHEGWYMFPALTSFTSLWCLLLLQHSPFSLLSLPADTELIHIEGMALESIMPLSHQQVSPWPFKGLASGTKKAERCCFKPLQALQILSCCFLTGPTQPGTACLTLWLLMSESTCSLRLPSPPPALPLPFFSLSLSLSMSSLLPPIVS